mmetsp:Transcript_2063/g.4736  ORF Transcript_2063/g.4736 Transcript_2063/m.4736 type:complete len:377 (+) Transcript_2063:108-1238(+)
MPGHRRVLARAASLRRQRPVHQRCGQLLLSVSRRVRWHGAGVRQAACRGVGRDERQPGARRRHLRQPHRHGPEPHWPQVRLQPSAGISHCCQARCRGAVPVLDQQGLADSLGRRLHAPGRTHARPWWRGSDRNGSRPNREVGGGCLEHPGSSPPESSSSQGCAVVRCCCEWVWNFPTGRESQQRRWCSRPPVSVVDCVWPARRHWLECSRELQRRAGVPGQDLAAANEHLPRHSLQRRVLPLRPVPGCPLRLPQALPPSRHGLLHDCDPRCPHDQADGSVRPAAALLCGRDGQQGAQAAVDPCVHAWLHARPQASLSAVAGCPHGRPSFQGDIPAEGVVRGEPQRGHHHACYHGQRQSAGAGRCHRGRAPRGRRGV